MPEPPVRITVTVNGEPRLLARGTTVRALLDELKAPREGVAVERNRRLVRRAEQESVLLEEGDRIEVVTLVGGG